MHVLWHIVFDRSLLVVTVLCALAGMEWKDLKVILGINLWTIEFIIRQTLPLRRRVGLRMMANLITGKKGRENDC